MGFIRFGPSSTPCSRIGCLGGGGKDTTAIKDNSNNGHGTDQTDEAEHTKLCVHLRFRTLDRGIDLSRIPTGVLLSD